MHPEASRLSVQKWKAKSKDAISRYRKKWLAENREKVLLQQRRKYQEKLDFIREVVGTVCVDCTEDRPAAIQYHHPNGRSEKKAPTLCGWEKLKEEVMHLIAICATCHSVRHRGELA